MSDDVDLDRFGPRRSDPNHASAARVYDCLLGGTYYYPVDQAAAEQLLKTFPLTEYLARYNRAWVQRAVRYLVKECGCRQFLDIGSGIPTAGNVHEVAQEIAPTTRVVYADYERVAIDIGLEILEDNQYATSIHADMRQPETILEHPDTHALLDFDKPIAMVWGSMLHFIEDQDDPHGIFGRYKSTLKSGDYLALSHVTEHFLSDGPLEQWRAFITKYDEYVTETLTSRSFEEVMSFFEGSELAEPGLVPLPDWRSDLPNYEPDLHDVARGVLVGGVGRLV